MALMLGMAAGLGACGGEPATGTRQAAITLPAGFESTVFADDGASGK